MAVCVFEEILGKVLVDVCVDNTIDEVKFTCDDGAEYVLKHYQDCCEDVHIESIVGDIQDLVGHPILMAERVESDDNSEEFESATWTFLKFATVKGYVDIRFHGSSNGYYGESADMYKL